MKAPPVLLLWLAALLAASACRSPESSRAVSLWTGMETELPVLRRLASEFSQATGIPVRVLKVPFNQLRNKFLIAAPAGVGPDLLLGPQDWVGVLAAAGLLEPLSADRDRFLPVALEATTFQKKLYALPLFTECLALIRNPRILPRRPPTLEEFLEAAAAARHTPGVDYGLYYEVHNLYFSFPFFAAHGVSIFGKRNGVIDPLDLDLGSPGAIEAARLLRAIRSQQGIPADATPDFAKSLYLEGRAAAILNGPWMLGDLRKAGVPYSIEPLPPTARGQKLRPFVGVQGIMLRRGARRRREALALMEHLAEPRAVAALCRASGRPPALREALREVADDADITAFGRVAQEGIPMPNHPAMGAVWEPMHQALELVTTGREAPERELPETVERIREKIRRMLE